MKRLLAVSCALALSACATVGVQTPGQGLFAAYGTYTAALTAASDYSNSPNASPEIVSALNRTNKKVEPFRLFVQAYRACVVQKQTSVVIERSTILCGTYDFSATSVRSAATALRDAGYALSGAVR